MKKGYLVLQDGQVFEGLRFGAEHDTVGELVFTTGMCGYIETLTDPSYAGQIVMQTYPLIGNYGIIRADFEGPCCVKGYVVREYCDMPSNFRTDCALDTFLKEQSVPGLYGVDTRELTRIIREHGVMNAAICDEIPADLTPVRTYAVTGVVEAVSCKAPVIHPAEGSGASGCPSSTTAPSAISSGSFKSVAVRSRFCPRLSPRKKFWPRRRMDSCSPTAPATRRRIPIRSSRFAGFWEKSRCLVSALATN